MQNLKRVAQAPGQKGRPARGNGGGRCFCIKEFGEKSGVRVLWRLRCPVSAPLRLRRSPRAPVLPASVCDESRPSSTGERLPASLKSFGPLRRGRFPFRALPPQARSVPFSTLRVGLMLGLTGEGLGVARAVGGKGRAASSLSIGGAAGGEGRLFVHSCPLGLGQGAPTRVSDGVIGTRGMGRAWPHALSVPARARLSSPQAVESGLTRTLFRIIPEFRSEHVNLERYARACSRDPLLHSTPARFGSHQKLGW